MIAAPTPTQCPALQLPSASRSKPFDVSLGLRGTTNLSFSSNNVVRLQRLHTSRRPLKVNARLSDEGRTGSASMFVGGFVLGGVIVGTLGCVFAPQISKALAGADSKDLMKKLPKFIYDEEKALEKTRKKLAEKIDQLNSAIDSVSVHLHPEDEEKENAVESDEVSATV